MANKTVHSKKKNREQELLEKTNGVLVGSDPKHRHTNEELKQILSDIRNNSKKEE